MKNERVHPSYRPCSLGGPPKLFLGHYQYQKSHEGLEIANLVVQMLLRSQATQADSHLFSTLCLKLT